MEDTTYALPEDLKPRVSLKEDDLEQDDLLQEYLNSAAYIVDYVTRKPPRGKEAFSASEEETRLFDDPLWPYGSYWANSNGAVIEIDDLLEVTAITRASTALVATDYILRPYNQYPKTQLVIVRYVTPTTTEGYVTPYPGLGTAQISITGVWGFCTDEDDRPPVVREAVLTQAERMYERMGLKARDLANAVRDPWKAIDPFVLAMLEVAGLCRADRADKREVVV